MNPNCISDVEFTQLQNQFIELRTTNYALEDKNRKQAAVLSELETRLRRSSADAARLQQVVDKSRRARDLDLMLQTNASLEQKLTSQEDEFRLQNQTLLQELATYVSANEKLEKELLAAKEGQPEPKDTPNAEEVLQLRAEAAALRHELAAASSRSADQLDESRHKVTALTELNSQLERACRPDDESPTASEDSDYVEVGGREVCYKRAATGAHELLQAAETRMHQLQADLQQFADMRLSLDMVRRELELCRDELQRRRDADAAGGEMQQLRQKLAKKQESYLGLQAEMEHLRQSMQADIDELKQQQLRDAADAQSRTQRYQTQLSNGYSVLKAERERSTATFRRLTERLGKYEALGEEDNVWTAAAETASDCASSAEMSPQSTASAADCHRAQRDRSAAEQALAETEAMLADTQARLAQTDARLSETEARLDEKKRGLSEAESRLSEMETRLEEYDSRLVNAAARLASSEAQYFQLKDELEATSQLASQRKSVLDEMAAHIEQLTADHIEQLRVAGQARQLAQSLADQRAEQLHELEAAVTRAEGTTRQVEETLQSERQRRHQLEQRLTEQELQQAAQMQALQEEAQLQRQESDRQLQLLIQSHTNEVKDLTTQLEISSAMLSEFKEKTAALRQEVKDSVDEKRIHERKGAAVTKDLRRQLAQERRRADRLQQALQDAPLADKQSGERSPPTEGDTQSVSSWSLMSGENGTSSAVGSGDLPVDTETAALLARITRLQEEKWRVEEKLNHLEQSSGALADDLANKASIIQFYCMEGRAPAAPLVAQAGRHRDGAGKSGVADAVAPVKKLVDFVKHLSLDEQQREMQRRMQRMLEETLTKNMCLSNDLKAMSNQLAAARAAAPEPAAP